MVFFIQVIFYLLLVTARKISPLCYRLFSQSVFLWFFFSKQSIKIVGVIWEIAVCFLQVLLN